MLTISVGGSVISVPISSRVEICYKENGLELLINKQVVLKNIKGCIEVKVSS